MKRLKYTHVVSGQFKRRCNRFIAEVVIEGVQEQVHIKNTGRLKEFLHPEADVLLEVNDNPNRKTRFSLIAVKKYERWVNIDSQAPNIVAYEAIKEGKVGEFRDINLLRKEVTFEGSRFDLYFESDDRKGFIEVKGVTLQSNGEAMFPDAPTTRGTKHVRELIKAVQEGYQTTILFVIQMKGCHLFRPHKEMDQVFADALLEAYRNGVHILAYDSIVKEDRLILDQPIPVCLFE